MSENFHCERFHLDMPAERQKEFCAKRFRKGGDFCAECETGKAAAEIVREEIHAALPPVKGQGDRSKKWIKTHDIRRQENMSEKKKLCSCGCGKGAVKDGLATKCYRKKYGKAPFGKSADKPKGNGARSAGKTGYVPSAEEEYLNSIGMTQIADELKKLRLVSQMVKKILS